MSNALAPKETKNNAPTTLATVKSEVVDKVAEQIRSFIEKGRLHMPHGYSAENAMKSAFLAMVEVKDKDGKAALTVCKRESVATALMQMAVQGLDPSKKQCYFIVYGDQLVCQRSYFGDEALAKRVLPGANVYAQVVYDGDGFVYDLSGGHPRVVKHTQALGNRDASKIVGAYAVIEDAGGTVVSGVVMSIDEIKRSWSMSKTYRPDGTSTPHHKFPGEMCLRTVVRKACKRVINSSTDELLMEHVRAMDALAAKAEADAEAAEHGLAYELEPLPAPPADPETGEVEEPTSEAPY